MFLPRDTILAFKVRRSNNPTSKGYTQAFPQMWITMRTTYFQHVIHVEFRFYAEMGKTMSPQLTFHAFWRIVGEE